MTWEHEVVILEKNVRDLQKQLNQAHKRIKTLVDQNTRKNVSLKMSAMKMSGALNEDNSTR